MRTADGKDVSNEQLFKQRFTQRINPNFDPDKEEGTYEEFSEANRLIAQIKRSVAFGATYHPFAQNQLDGVASEIDIAIMNDMPG
jgi:hypothetical protein